MHYAEEEMQYHLQIHNGAGLENMSFCRETLNGVKKSPHILNIRF